MTLRTVIRFSPAPTVTQVLHTVGEITGIPAGEFHPQTALADVPGFQQRGQTTYATDYGRGWDARVSITCNPATDPNPNAPLTGLELPTGAAEVTFDTAYGYRGPAGDCNRLHATYITALARWCEQHGLSWAWQNEYTGQWHTDATDSIQDFIAA